MYCREYYEFKQLFAEPFYTVLDIRASIFQNTTSHINNINNSDTELSKKITEILNIYEKNPNLKANNQSKNGVIFVDDTDTALLNADKNNKITKINHKI